METNDRTKGIHRHPTQPFGAVRGVTSRQTHHVLEEPCMTPIRPSRLRPSRLLTSRLGIVAAATIGFAVGAVGFAAAQPDDASPEVMAPPASTDDGPTTSVDDGPTVTSGSTVTTVDDGPVTSVDDGPTTSVASALPEPFTTSYSSSGGSIGVTWSGTAFTLNSVTPAAGFRAEIEHQSWDRVRVDFEGADDDARIEVRINDG